jgi:hypothetical protein
MLDEDAVSSKTQSTSFGHVNANRSARTPSVVPKQRKDARPTKVEDTFF